MSNQNPGDHSFLLCELAAILAMLASAPMAAAQNRTESSAPPKATQDDASPVELGTREPIRYDHVYGSKRISIGAFSPTRFTWLDDEFYIRRESSGWVKVSAKTGDVSPWYDVELLKQELSQQVTGISESDAERLANGAWIESLPSQGIVLFRIGERLIRSRLDGTDIAVVEGVPADVELTTLSPTGSGFAFVRKNELWVADFDAKVVRQLTHDAASAVRNAKADWVYFEEVYGRNWQAYRWSPDGTKLAYQQFNDTDVPTFQIAAHTTVEQLFETESYPKAGDTNPNVRLGVVAMSGGETTWIDTSEYSGNDLIIAHFNWLSDSSGIYWYAQNRIQTWLDVWTTSLPAAANTRLLRDETAAWVDNPLDATFLSDGSFLFFSEHTGWRHLYRVSSNGKEMKAVTSGEWEVRKLHTVDAAEEHVFVTGTKDSHIAENLYRISLKDAEVTRLTPEDAMHVASVSDHGSYTVDSFSSLNEPARVVVRDTDGSELRVLSEPVAVPRDKYTFGTVELRDVPMADGSTTKAIFVLPPDFDTSLQYPVWLRTYGGPHHPQVKNAWGNRMPDHLLANLGIVVVIWDPRTASGYGAKSAWLAYKQLGVEETKDLESLCGWLQNQSWVDSKRIGLSGHSYGGYFTSYAMTHSDKICAGIAGAPVTDWANYDTIYTERFMSTPQLNPDGYEKSSVVSVAANLKGRLLILHGLKDDNVHPENTIQLMNALQKADRSFEVMFYPTSRHGIYGDHYNRLCFNFIVDAMGKPEAKQQ